MKILLSIDDTDNLDSPGTGHLLDKLKKEIEELGWGKSSRITRHQLFVHPKVPYTSHNSAMCCEIDLKENRIKTLIEYGQKFLEKISAPGSDPGLGVLSLDSLTKTDKDLLISFGQQSKKKVLTKKEAYSLAKKINLHLSEHGGTGDGIIGALAALGLRLSGYDGRYKGWFSAPKENGVLTVETLCSWPEIDEVRTIDKKDKLSDQTKVLLKGKLKTILWDYKSILLVEKSDHKDKGINWQSCPKEKIKMF